MTLLSILRSGSSVLTRSTNRTQCLQTVVRQMGGHGPEKMVIQPSRYQWHKFKDLFHFYTMLGVIPLSALTLYVNIFIGPAKLADIPEGYVPKEHEYFPHPISRWISKYLVSNHQKDYEKHIHAMFIIEEKREMKKIEKQVNELIKERLDSYAYYYDPAITKYHKKVRKFYEDKEFSVGFNAKPVE